MGKKSKDEDCCERYKKGKKACKDCPRMEKLDKAERRRLLDKYR